MSEYERQAQEREAALLAERQAIEAQRTAEAAAGHDAVLNRIEAQVSRVPSVDEFGL